MRKNTFRPHSSCSQPRQASQPLGFFIYSIIAEPTISRDNYIRLAEMPGIFTGVVTGQYMACCWHHSHPQVICILNLKFEI